MDGEPANVAFDRRPKRIADRGIHLARDLRHRDTVGDGQLELDVERLPEVDADPRVAEPEPAEHALERLGGEASDAVRTQRGRAHDVDDGPPGDERSTGGRLGRHAGSVLLA